MLAELMSKEIDPEHLLSVIRTTDMTLEVEKLIDRLPNQDNFNDANARRAAILEIVNPQTHTLTLHCTDFANISIKAPHPATASELYSVPGYSFLFAIHQQPFTLQLYRVTDEQLTIDDRVTVREGHPVLIDGRHTIFDCTPSDQGQAFIGSLNVPDRSADISVFDRASLHKVAWFPHDDSAARYLVSLELLEAAQDPGAAKVAQELIYHYHPAVAWRAFQVIYQHDQSTALQYVPLLRQLQNSRLDHLLDHYSEAA
jgi:hypothetical protein